MKTHQAVILLATAWIAAGASSVNASPLTAEEVSAVKARISAIIARPGAEPGPDIFPADGRIAGTYAVTPINDSAPLVSCDRVVEGWTHARALVPLVNSAVNEFLANRCVVRAESLSEEIRRLVDEVNASYPAAFSVPDRIIHYSWQVFDEMDVKAWAARGKVFASSFEPLNLGDIPDILGSPRRSGELIVMERRMSASWACFDGIRTQLKVRITDQLGPRISGSYSLILHVE